MVWKMLDGRTENKVAQSPPSAMAGVKAGRNKAFVNYLW